jgi:hypothetical protein
MLDIEYNYGYMMPTWMFLNALIVIVTPRQHDACRRVHCWTSDIVWMRFERSYFFMCVVVEYA